MDRVNVLTPRQKWRMTLHKKDQIIRMLAPQNTPIKIQLTHEPEIMSFFILYNMYNIGITFTIKLFLSSAYSILSLYLELFRFIGPCLTRLVFDRRYSLKYIRSAIQRIHLWPCL